MIRFEPDTWRDALLRPLAMIAPNAGVYVEIHAPDWRFVVAIVLGAVAIAANWRRIGQRSTMAAVTAWLVAAFAVWLATSGNGRYFIPGLLVIGPVCLALAYRLPGSRSLRMTAALVAVGLQLFAVSSVTPWRSWGWAPWRDGTYFPVQLDEQARTQPATYVTVSNISYSLIAPQFPAESRWINISTLPDVSDVNSIDMQRAQKIIKESKSLQFTAPSRPDFMDAARNPSPELATEIDRMLNGQLLALKRPLSCRLLPSQGMASIALKDIGTASPQTLAKMGFWVCDLQYPVARVEPPAAQQHTVADAAFAQVEKQCPRFFLPGQVGATPIEDDGWMRTYAQSDLRLFLLKDGVVYYKYGRALNMVRLGEAEAIRKGAAVDCNHIRGRTGLPWEREI